MVQDILQVTVQVLKSPQPQGVLCSPDRLLVVVATPLAQPWTVSTVSPPEDFRIRK